MCALVELVNLRVEAGHVVFEAPLCDLISLCGRPIVREKVGLGLGLRLGLAGTGRLFST